MVWCDECGSDNRDRHHLTGYRPLCQACFRRVMAELGAFLQRLLAG